MKLSNLNETGKKELINEIHNMPFLYRTKLNFDNNITFGIEIEYEKARRDVIEDCIKDFEGEILNYKINFNKWRFDNEESLIEKINGVRFGGEVVSPIFKNRIKYYNQIKKVCETLKENNGIVTDKTAFQVHVGKEVLKSRLIYLENFIKLFMLYEDIIYKFGYYGNNPREEILDYAENISCKLYEILNEKEYDDFYQLIEKLRSKLGFKKSSISFHNMDITQNRTFKKNTVEFRLFNGTLNEVIMQNIINLCCSMLSSSANNSFDIEKINYDIDKFKKGLYAKENLEPDIDRAIEFSDIIFSDDIDKKYFLKQYLM